MVRRAIERGLSDVFHVTMAEDGLAALKHIEQAARVDLILTDIRMPNLDGLGFHRALREKHPELARRTIFMSGSLDEDAVHRELAKIGTATIAKPFSVRALQQQLIELLEVWGMNEPQAAPVAATGE